MSAIDYEMDKGALTLGIVAATGFLTTATQQCCLDNSPNRGGYTCTALASQAYISSQIQIVSGPPHTPPHLPQTAHTKVSTNQQEIINNNGQRRIAT